MLQILPTGGARAAMIGPMTRETGSIGRFDIALTGVFGPLGRATAGPA
jgi:hypothetical protein